MTLAEANGWTRDEALAELEVQVAQQFAWQFGGSWPVASERTLAVVRGMAANIGVDIHPGPVFASVWDERQQREVLVLVIAPEPLSQRNWDGDGA